MLSGINMYIRRVPEIEETMEHKKVLEKILANISPNTKHKAMKGTADSKSKRKSSKPQETNDASHPRE